MPVVAGGLDVTDVRRLLPEVLENVKGRKRMTWMILSQNAQVLDVTGGVLTLGLEKAGTRTGFLNSGSDEVLRQALLDVFRADFRVETVLDPTAVPADREPVTSRRDPFDDPRGPGSDPDLPGAEPAASAPPRRRAPEAGRAAHQPETAPTADGGSVRPETDGAQAPAPRMRGRALADAARQAGPSAKVDPDEAVDITGDPVTDTGGETQSDLLARELGATVIDEYTEN
jgi:DNA polymerase-3 subunit gamma/tau